MAATVWKGYIAFGLISIPVRLFTAARNERAELHQLHEVCSTRVKQQLYCPHCERTVERSEIVKGYEVNKGQWVTVEDSELKKIAPASTETMDIQQFVKIDDIDPLYYDASYYVAPEDAGRRAYSLLLETMKKTGFAATAKVAMHQREYIVVIRPREKGLALHTLYYPNEVRAVPEFERIKTVDLKAQEVQLAEQLVQSLAGPFKPDEYEDEYRTKVLEMIEAKAEGRKIKGEAHKKRAPVIDLMKALERSLGGAKTRSKSAAKTARKAAAHTAHGKRPAARRMAS